MFPLPLVGEPQTAPFEPTQLHDTEAKSVAVRSASMTLTPLTSDGPAFATVTRNVRGPPGTAEV